MILLDTHVVIWLAQEIERLSQPAKAAIAEGRANGGLAISSLTLFETAQLVSKGRLRVEPSLERFLAELETLFVIKQVDARVASAAAKFTEPYPRDPMDRLIGATAIVEGLTLVTADERIRQSEQVQTIW
jgi:PIN domain nuclease of toxin-antitoxin system